MRSAETGSKSSGVALASRSFLSIAVVDGLAVKAIGEMNLPHWMLALAGGTILILGVRFGSIPSLSDSMGGLSYGADLIPCIWPH